MRRSAAIDFRRTKYDGILHRIVETETGVAIIANDRELQVTLDRLARLQA